MIKFIKNLLGFGAKETVQEILTPPAQSDTLATALTASTYVEPAKPINKKVKAIGETGVEAVKAATAPKPANKQRKPYKGNKPKAKPAVTQGNTKGGNGAVKQQPKQSVKPQAPKPPKKK